MKPGYKQTEVGVIPAEWDVSGIGTLCTAVLDCHHSTPVWTGSGSIVIRNQNIRDGKLDLAQPSFTDETHFAERTRRAVPSFGDLVITREAPMGLVCMIPNDLKCCLGQRMVLLRPNYDRADTEYLLYALLSEAFQRSISVAGGTGSTVSNLRIPVLKGLEIPAPPLPEQRAIATALSDVDGLLGGLDRLSAKKRDLKQAAMQQLLTGQTRLPGFHGEWQVKRLGDVGSIYGGLTGKTKADFGEGPARYITFMNVMANVVIDCGTFERVQVSPTESQHRAMKGDLFFNGSSETPEEVAMCSVLLDEVQGVYLNSFCFGFRFHDDAEADGLFLAYYLRSKEGRELMKSLAQGSTRYNLSKVALLKSPLRVPRLPEQTAIASVLTEMDGELAVLEQRREKTRALKQAMMQELLTGRTRLL
jgi:type I restriction enzyme S subunit